MRTLAKLLVAGAALGAVVPAANAATINVTTTTDVIANDGQCSLREALFAAYYDAQTPPSLNCTAGAGDDIVQLEAATYRLAAGGAREDLGMTGDFDISGLGKAVRVVGRGMDATSIGGTGDRVFDVFAGTTLGLTDLTVRDGVAPPGQSGGAVRNKGALTAFRVAFVNSVAGEGVPATGEAYPGDAPQPPGSGGAVYSSGVLEVVDSSFSATRAGDGTDARTIGATTWGPTAGGNGGAVDVDGGTASFTGVTVGGTRAGHGGTTGPNLPSTSSGGDGGDGGAIAVTQGGATITNSTFAGNRAGNAGSPRLGYHSEAVPGNGGAVAVATGAAATVTFSTFSGNAVGGGDGVIGVGASVSGATVSASILADAGSACATPTSGALANVTLPGDNSCPGTKIVGDPKLGALGANGGPTPTMLPGAGSAAINVFTAVPCPGSDQRGLGRPANGACDAGAVEVQPSEPGAAALPGAGGGAKTLAPGSTTARRITGVTLSRTAFRTYGTKKGTTLGFRLNTPSSIVLTVTKPASGRRSKGKCVAPTKKLSGKARCTRQVPVKGSLSKAGKAGLNTIAFSGKLRGRALAPGAYTFVLTLPKLGSSKPVVATKGFRVIP